MRRTWDVMDWDDGVAVRGHVTTDEFREVVLDYQGDLEHWFATITPETAQHEYWRVRVARENEHDCSSDDERQYVYDVCAPGRGAFPVTVWYRP